MDDTLNKTIKVRIDDVSYNMAKEEAADMGISFSEFVRRCITSKKLQVHLYYQPSDKQLKELANELSRIGNNLNQIARKLNGNEVFNQTMSELLNESLTALYDLILRIGKIMEDSYGHNKAYRIEELPLHRLRGLLDNDS